MLALYYIGLYAYMWSCLVYIIYVKYYYSLLPFTLPSVFWSVFPQISQNFFGPRTIFMIKVHLSYYYCYIPA